MTVAKGQIVLPDGQSTQTTWVLAQEVALQLLIDGEIFGVMMVTPSQIEEFVRGFCLTEKVLQPREIDDVRIEAAADGILVNVISKRARSGNEPLTARALPMRSSCGICGAQTFADALPNLPNVATVTPQPTAIQNAFDALPSMQDMRRADKSSHAASFADLHGNLIAIAEDVGRHNALDKLIGQLLVTQVDRENGFLVLSSRLSVEMVQKAAMAGFGAVVSASAPTQLALKRAHECGMHVSCLAGNGIMDFGG